MFTALETSLKDLLAGAVAGAPVFGTFDFLDFTGQGAPTVAVRVDWAGFVPRSRKDDALLGDQQFAVTVVVNAIRVRPVDRAAAVVGIKTLLERLVGWRPREHLQVQIDPGAPSAEAPGLWLYTINLTIPDTVIRASS
ncbi:hypothetical protein [Aromatoleum aromaticum]|uniref:hypothetical protein n=1 Tax=Aromatoleum aromaticum TaxID=551760 RepID=UPI0014598A32|nr:hypothetical protein [Aromatoleum aromaticum]NMG56522.1 hypothetical protein [Aromatoleum aromaticum]